MTDIAAITPLSNTPIAPADVSSAENERFAKEVDEFFSGIPAMTTELVQLTSNANAAVSRVSEIYSYSDGLQNYQGDWSGATTYEIDESVSYNGFLYVSRIGSNLNNTPADDANWYLVDLAQGSDAGGFLDFGEDSGSINLDLATYDSFRIVATGNITFSISGIVTGSIKNFSVLVERADQYSITWPSEVQGATAFSSDYQKVYKPSLNYIDIATDFGSTGCGRGGVFANEGMYLFYIESSPDDEIRRLDFDYPYEIGTEESTTVGFDISTDFTIGNIVKVSDDGFVIWVIDITNDKLLQYDLGAAFDHTTAVLGDEFYFGGTASGPTGGWMNDDIDKLYIADSATRRIYQFSASTSGDITTFSYDSKSYYWQGSAEISDPISVSGISVLEDGTGLYWIDLPMSALMFWTMPTPFDISTLTFSGRKSFGAITSPYFNDITTFQYCPLNFVPNSGVFSLLSMQGDMAIFNIPTKKIFQLQQIDDTDVSVINELEF
ncbi:MAG: hypothetical protein ACSHWQ_04005 [Spongiibacteraceae bacterium]